MAFLLQSKIGTILLCFYIPTFFGFTRKKYTNFNTFMKNEKEQTKNWFSWAGYAKTGKGKATREMF